MVWNREDPDERARLLIAGCFAVLYTRLSDETMCQAIQSFAVHRRDASIDRIRRENAETECSLSDFDSPNPVMKGLLNIVRRVVEPDTSLLFLGETGVGEKRLARGIHADCPRASHPFVPVPSRRIKASSATCPTWPTIRATAERATRRRCFSSGWPRFAKPRKSRTSSKGRIETWRGGLVPTVHQNRDAKVHLALPTNPTGESGLDSIACFVHGCKSARSGLHGGPREAKPARIPKACAARS